MAGTRSQIVSTWSFALNFVSFLLSDDEKVLRILENDLILKHDCIWPHGLNFRLHVDSLLEVSEFRKSCIRHNWPPDGDALDSLEIDVEKLRNQVKTTPAMEIPVAEVAPMRKKAKPKEEEERPQWSDDFRIDRKKDKEKDDRPSSPASVTSENAEMTSSTTSSSSETQKTQAAAGKKPASGKQVSNVKKTAAKKAPASPKKEPAKSVSSHSVGSDVSVEDQETEAAIGKENKPLSAKQKQKTQSQEKSPHQLRKEATRIIKKTEIEEEVEPEAENAEEEGNEGPEKIDSSTRPVTPTLPQESTTDESNLASQVSEALESAQVEDADDDEDATDDIKTEKLQKPVVSKSKLPSSSPRRTAKPAARGKKVAK